MAWAERAGRGGRGDDGVKTSYSCGRIDGDKGVRAHLIAELVVDQGLRAEGAQVHRLVEPHGVVVNVNLWRETGAKTATAASA